MIKFEEIETKELVKFNNGEGITFGKIFNDGNVKIMRATLKKGSSIGLHTHKTSLEVMYVLSGVATCLIDGKKEVLSKGEVHYCPNGIEHSIRNENDEDLVMLCIVPEVNK